MFSTRIIPERGWKRKAGFMNSFVIFSERLLAHFWIPNSVTGRDGLFLVNRFENWYLLPVKKNLLENYGVVMIVTGKLELSQFSIHADSNWGYDSAILLTFYDVHNKWKSCWTFGNDLRLSVKSMKKTIAKQIETYKIWLSLLTI